MLFRSGGLSWLKYAGGTAMTRAAFSGDMQLIKLLLRYGADPNAETKDHTTALMAASGIGWIHSFSVERSQEETLQVAKLLIELGADINHQNDDGRTAMHAAAHKGRNNLIEYYVANGGRLDIKDKGSADSTEPLIPLDYAIGVRFNANSVVPQPQTETYVRKLMAERGIAHTTSECTLRGFTCGTIDAKQIAKDPTLVEKLKQQEQKDLLEKKNQDAIQQKDQK